MAIKDTPNPGMAVDAGGNPVVDPTANVLQLVDAAVKRINDLHVQEIEFTEKIRQGDLKYFNDKIDGEIKRLDDLRELQVKKLEENLAEHKISNKTYNCETKESVEDKLKSQKTLSEAVLIERDAKLTDKFSSLATATDKAFEAQKTLSDAVLSERDAKLTDKFASLATAINKAEIATEKRFESVNEFRAVLTSQQTTLLPRLEYDAGHRNLAELITSNVKTLSDTILTQKERIDKLDNIKQGSSNLWIIIVVVIGFATGLISFIMNMLGK